MEFTVRQYGRVNAVVAGGGEVFFSEASDALEFISACWEAGVNHVVIPAANIDPAFFDLRTGIAGEALQKFTQYNISAAIIGDFSALESRALRDFIRESNRGGRIIFAATEKEAFLRLE